MKATKTQGNGELETKWLNSIGFQATKVEYFTPSKEPHFIKVWYGKTFDKIVVKGSTNWETALKVYVREFVPSGNVYEIVNGEAI